MAIYTGVADANGDFNIPFSANYTGGQKVTVTAEKDAATKTIELYAPSEVAGGGVIQFSGTLNDFPNNIGDISISQISGVINTYSFHGGANASTIFRKATGLVLPDGITEIRDYAFYQWDKATSLSIPDTVTLIGNNAFNLWAALTSLDIPSSVTSIGAYAFANLTLCKSISATFPSVIQAYSFSQWTSFDSTLSINEGVTTINSNAFQNWNKAISLNLPSTLTTVQANAFAQWSSCDVITCLATTPPIIQSTTFSSLKSTCIFEVPAESVAAYQAAPSWSAFAARIEAI